MCREVLLPQLCVERCCWLNCVSRGVVGSIQGVVVCVERCCWLNCVSRGVVAQLCVERCCCLNCV